jgi:hypothetical protein
MASEHYSWASFSTSNLLSNKLVEFLSKETFIQSLEQLRQHPALSSWAFLDDHAANIFRVIAEVDLAEQDFQAQLACIKYKDDSDNKLTLHTEPGLPTRKRSAPVHMARRVRQ